MLYKLNKFVLLIEKLLIKKMKAIVEFFKHSSLLLLFFYFQFFTLFPYLYWAPWSTF